MKPPKNPFRISFDVYTRLRNIFRKHGWPIRVEGRHTDIFNNYGRLLERLNHQHQELILFLTEDFLHCPIEHYAKTLIRALNRIERTKIDAFEKIFVLPLVPIEDFGMSKSAHFMSYLCRTEVVPKIAHLRVKKPNVYQDIRDFNRLESGRHGSLLLFLDDFIGTGKTACKALDDYRNENYIKGDDAVIVTALVAQEQGIKAIEDLGYEVFTSHVKSRGISDSPRFPHGTFTDATATLQIMSILEDHLGYRESSHLRFGYKRSEALVAMMNTPDNTFPVFWSNRSVDGRKWPAPFPRVED